MSDFEESDVEPEKEQDEELSDKEEFIKKKPNSTSVQKKIKSGEEEEVDESDDDNSSILDSDDDLEMDDDEDDIDELADLDDDDFQETDKKEEFEDASGIKPLISPINSDVESDDEEEYQKFDNEISNNYVNINHPESYTQNAVEIESLCVIKRNENGDIDDENHKTIPILSKYEKTRILGQRAKQINNGAKPLLTVPSDILNGYLIAQMELEKKLIPVIIQRPMPNGKSEFWKLNDLEII